jgi:hypothetical protein
VLTARREVLNVLMAHPAHLFFLQETRRNVESTPQTRFFNRLCRPGDDIRGGIATGVDERLISRDLTDSVVPKTFLSSDLELLFV